MSISRYEIRLNLEIDGKVVTEVQREVLHAAFRRVFGTDSPGIVLLACENDPEARRAVEAAYAAIKHKLKAVAD